MNKPLRFWIIMGILGVFALIVVVRYGYLALQGPASNKISSTELERGRITDRSGRILAMDAPSYNLAVWKPETSSKKFLEMADRLAEQAQMSPEEIQIKYSESDSNFFYLKKKLPFQIARVIMEDKAKGLLSGIVVEKVAGRLYPEKQLAANLLGFVGEGNKGLSGLEAKYNSVLLPQNPSSGLQRGQNLELSINADIQYSLEKIAAKARVETQAEAVILLALDSQTGEFLAYVNSPDFDPNDFLSSDPTIWSDKPSIYAYEPGSVFKVFTLASVVELGGANKDSTFFCDGAYHRTTPSGEKITIACLGVHGTVNIEKILEYSCNAGAGYAADTVAGNDLYRKLKDFGFGSKTSLALAGETAGQLQAPELWSLRSRPTIGMGQEILVSAVQMTTAALALANKGLLVKPIIVRKITNPDDSIAFNNQPQFLRRVVSEKTAELILQSMEQSASNTGTGRRASISDVRMAVKTGTAQMINRETRAYSDKDFIASTLAIFPADKPRAIIYLAIIKPTKGESYFGGRIAAPVVKEAAEAVLTLLDLPRGNSPTIEHSGKILISPIQPLVIGKTMPNLIGQPKRMLLPLLVIKGLRVIINGDGYVTKQNPEAGTTLAEGTKIILDLE